MVTKKTTKKAAVKKTPVSKAASAKKTVATKSKKVSKKKITEDQIRLKAQEIYENRLVNAIGGDEHTDWIQAEKELGVK